VLLQKVQSALLECMARESNYNGRNDVQNWKNLFFLLLPRKNPIENGGDLSFACGHSWIDFFMKNLFWLRGMRLLSSIFIEITYISISGLDELKTGS
jgi:hypothetical protein